MNCSGFQMRYINTQCYEFILPGGSHLITDPYITPANLAGFREFTVEEIERCDYILLTHSHYDHTSDIGYLFEKFDCRVFCSSMVAAELVKVFGVHPGMIYPFDNMDTYEMPDFTLTAVRGKHYPMRNMSFDPKAVPKGFGGEEHGMLNLLGTIFSYDFCLTFKNNIRIMFVSGIDELNNIYRAAESFRPNVLFRHTAGSVEAEEWSRVIAKFGAQLAFPCHQDKLYNGSHGKKMEDFTADIREGLRKLGSSTEFINPEPYKWYSVSLGIEALD